MWYDIVIVNEDIFIEYASQKYIYSLYFVTIIFYVQMSKTNKTYTFHYSIIPKLVVSFSKSCFAMLES